MNDEYLTLDQLHAYSKVSVRQLKRFLARRDESRLPHVRNGVRPLILKSVWDTWIQAETLRQTREPVPAPARSFRQIMTGVKAERRPLAKAAARRAAGPVEATG